MWSLECMTYKSGYFQLETWSVIERQKNFKAKTKMDKWFSKWDLNKLNTFLNADK